MTACQTLICLYEQEDVYIDLIVCDSNCEKRIAQIAQKKDIYVGMSGLRTQQRQNVGLMKMYKLFDERLTVQKSDFVN